MTTTQQQLRGYAITQVAKVTGQTLYLADKKKAPARRWTSFRGDAFMLHDYETAKKLASKFHYGDISITPVMW